MSIFRYTLSEDLLMKYILLLLLTVQFLLSNQSIVEAEKLKDNYQYTTTFNICVLEKVEKKQKAGNKEDYWSLYDEASSDCSYEYAKRIYKLYKL